MSGTEPAGPGGRLRGPGPPPGQAATINGPGDVSRVSRVDVNAPDRVLRIWAMLSSASDDMHQVSLRPGMIARLQRQLDALIAELELSLSPALAGELHHLLDREHASAVLTADELRVEYASLLAWTVGLVIQILTPLEAASAKSARTVPRPRPAS